MKAREFAAAATSREAFNLGACVSLLGAASYGMDRNRIESNISVGLSGKWYIFYSRFAFVSERVQKMPSLPSLLAGDFRRESGIIKS